jgi:hypothetical protein
LPHVVPDVSTGVANPNPKSLRQLPAVAVDGGAVWPSNGVDAGGPGGLT